MKLTTLYEGLVDNIKNSMGLAFFKKLEDPNRVPDNKDMPERSGNQDTPLKTRHRKFFNAPIGATIGKSGYQDNDDAESRRPRDIEDKTQNWPKDSNETDQEIEKLARKEFGHLAVAGAKPRLRL